VTSNAYCPRCFIELPDGRCRRCGWDFNVSTLTEEDRRLIKGITKAAAKGLKR
jgi:hypothetical protein